MEIEKLESTQNIQGASVEQVEELPMVVILRGDEPYAESFCRDADYVMEKLQIKRSRLTQISGKDLRVGRIRVDRYIRPMYRDEDIEKYQSWTRSPATHKNSSQMIDLAVERLEQKSEEFALGLKDVLSDIESGVAAEIKDHIASMVSFQKDESYRSSLESKKNWEQVFRFLSKQIEQINTLKASLEASFEDSMKEFSSYSEVLNYLHLEVKELRVENKSLQNTNSELKASLDSYQDQLLLEKEERDKLFEELSSKIDSGFSQLSSLQTKKTSPEKKASLNRYRRKSLRNL